MQMEPRTEVTESCRIASLCTRTRALQARVLVSAGCGHRQSVKNINTSHDSFLLPLRPSRGWIASHPTAFALSSRAGVHFPAHTPLPPPGEEGRWIALLRGALVSYFLLPHIPLMPASAGGVCVACSQQQPTRQSIATSSTHNFNEACARQVVSTKHLFLIRNRKQPKKARNHHDTQTFSRGKADLLHKLLNGVPHMGPAAVRHGDGRTIRPSHLGNA